MTAKKQPGLTLADLANQSEDVPVGSGFITVKGVSARQVLAIFKRFPKLAGMLNGFNMGTFIEAAPDAVAAIIAAGTGSFEDEKAEQDAADIGIEAQYDILEAIGRLTFKSGFGPFVEKVMALAGSAAKFDPSIKVPDMKSQPPSKTSSPAGTPSK